MQNSALKGHLSQAGERSGKEGSSGLESQLRGRANHSSSWLENGERWDGHLPVRAAVSIHRDLFISCVGAGHF